jgi:hypothetical protein
VIGKKIQRGVREVRGEKVGEVRRRAVVDVMAEVRDDANLRKVAKVRYQKVNGI